MARYKKNGVILEAIRLEYRTLIQTPVGAMSAEAGDYLETIRNGEHVCQRIVPAWAFEAMHGGEAKGKSKSVFPKACSCPPKASDAAKLTVCEPHDGYPLEIKSHE